MQNITVLKFGGSSLATAEQILSVAKKINTLYKQNRQLIVVTSAMGKTTDQLTAMAYKVSSKPNRREFDMLLSTGERVAMALMSMALHDLGCPSISFTGSQAGIMTDGAFSNARIKELKPIRVEEALRDRKVVVLAGFQGVDPITKEITTLGRGGSDTTAVAIAAHLKAERCEILKDVAGVFSADPKIIPKALLLKKIPIDKLYEMCFWGAKVLNYRSVEWARKHRVPLFIGRSDDFTIGTEITFEVDTSVDNNDPAGDLGESQTTSPLAVNSHEIVFEISVTCSDEKEGVAAIETLFRECQLPEPQILKSEFSAGGGNCRLLITSSHDVMSAAQSAIRYSSKVRLLQNNISTVTATFLNKPGEVHIVPQDARIELIRKYFA